MEIFQLLLQGFALNIAMSFLAMAIGILVGVALIVEGMKQWLKRGGPSP